MFGFVKEVSNPQVLRSLAKQVRQQRCSGLHRADAQEPTIPEQVRSEELTLSQETQPMFDQTTQGKTLIPSTAGIKSVPVAGKEVSSSSGDALLEWMESIKKELSNFERLEGLQEATFKERQEYKGKVLPCTMVFVKKFLTPQQVRESGSTKTWKAKSRMVICGNFSDQELLCDTSTQNVDIGLLRMMLSITNGKVETLTTTDIANAFFECTN